MLGCSPFRVVGRAVLLNRLVAANAGCAASVRFTPCCCSVSKIGTRAGVHNAVDLTASYSLKATRLTALTAAPDVCLFTFFLKKFDKSGL